MFFFFVNNADRRSSERIKLDNKKEARHDNK